MDFDHSFNGPVDWNFPSPTATPNTSSGTYDHTLFQTPKAASTPSHFRDAFATPQMPTFTTPQQPDYHTFTPGSKHQQHFSFTSPDLAHSAASNNASFSGQLDRPTNQATYQHTLANVFKNHTGGRAGFAPFDSVQIQTPPPTRGTSAEKFAVPEQPIAFGTPSTIASRRFMTPQQPSSHDARVMSSTQTPLQAPYLPFSPQVWQLGNNGPATAPELSSHTPDLMWSQSRANVLQSPTGLADPFAPSAMASMGWPSAVLPSNASAQSMLFDTPAMDSFPIQTPFLPQNSIIKPSADTGLTSAQRSSGSVDPSLVYSSPIRPQYSAKKDINLGGSREQNREDSRIEAEPASRSRADTLSTSFAGPMATQLRTGLRRSNTTGDVRLHNASHALTSDSFSRSGSMIPRTDSPLKRIGRPVLDPISETKKATLRRSVVLTVDENGRARTEMKQLEDSPTRRMRERYPAIYDSDSSDDDSENSGGVLSRNASFSFSKADERKSKAARLDAPIENLEGLSIPRPTSSTSLRVTPSRAAIAAAAQLRRNGSLRRSNSHRASLTNNRRSVIIDTCPMGELQPGQPDTDLGRQAQSNPFQSPTTLLSPTNGLSDWSSSTTTNNNATIDAHNRRWSIMSHEQQHHIHTPRGHSISPTHSAASSFVSFPPAPKRIRCVCGNNPTSPADDSASSSGLVQCRSCTQWSHTACVDPSKNLNMDGSGRTTRSSRTGAMAGFTCFLCTRPAPVTPVAAGRR